MADFRSPLGPEKAKGKLSQSERVIRKFGGARRLVSYLNELAITDESIRVPSSVYRWSYPKSKGGCGGVIPAKAMVLVIKASRLAGVLLTPDDFYPGEL